MMHTQPIVKRSIFLFLALLSIHFVGLTQNADTPYRIKTIVIDAGHGGKDPGNLGTGRYKTREKDIALDVALRVGSYIEKQFPEIKVIYTRKTDVFIGLDGRAEVANDAKADLFLSIHCNAFTNPESNGVETFVLGLHRNKENLQVAMKENSAIFLEDDYKTKYEGFDPNSAESIIALTIMQSAYLQQSLSISSYIQNQFKNRVGRRDRGVKQAGFLVLRKTTMPSILIELGFLTNASEEDFLNSENGKAFMASAIFRGFKEYKELVEDPLPEGYVEPASGNKDTTPTKVEAEKAMEEARAAEAAKKEAEKARQDSIKKVADQAKLKAVADSLEQAKQKLLDEQQQRQAELVKKAGEEKKADAEKQARLKAKADSLEQVRKNLLEEKRKRELELELQAKEELKAKLKARVDSLESLRLAKIEALEKEKEAIAAKKAQEEAELKAKQQAEKEAAEKELAAKEEAKKWLEEIKEVKEKELEEAKRQAEIDKEKARLLAIKEQKEKELEEARRLAEENRDKEVADSLKVAKLIAEQAKIDSLAKIADQKAKQDALAKEAELAAMRKAKQDSIDAAEKAKAEAAKEVVTIDSKKATTAEEAELLFLQLRKKQLEQRIAQLRGQDVKAVTKETVEERAAQKPEPINKVANATGSGVLFKVQIITSDSPLSKDDSRFRGQKVWEYQQGGLYKYTVGATRDFEEITKLQGELRDLGFQGAFAVAFKDGERIKVSEARELLNQ